MAVPREKNYWQWLFFFGCLSDFQHFSVGQVLTLGYLFEKKKKKQNKKWKVSVRWKVRGLYSASRLWEVGVGT
jgi:hypothetical protein